MVGRVCRVCRSSCTAKQEVGSISSTTTNPPSTTQRTLISLQYRVNTVTRSDSQGSSRTPVNPARLTSIHSASVNVRIPLSPSRWLRSFAHSIKDGIERRARFFGFVSPQLTQTLGITSLTIRSPDQYLYLYVSRLCIRVIQQQVVLGGIVVIVQWPHRYYCSSCHRYNTVIPAYKRWAASAGYSWNQDTKSEARRLSNAHCTLPETASTVAYGDTILVIVDEKHDRFNLRLFHMRGHVPI